MKKTFVYIGLSCFLLGNMSCKKWLDRDSLTIITEDQAFSSEAGVRSILANLYDRLPDGQRFDVGDMNNWGEASSGGGQDNSTDRGGGYREYWDYGLIRDINLFLQNLDAKGAVLDPPVKKYFKAEARFMRAYVYFEMVKRMGGVPLITEPFVYDQSADPASYRRARNKETEVYDYIATEIDAIKEDLNVSSSNQYVKNRATKAAALAMKSRAMLYAAAIGKYTAARPDLTLTTNGGEAGINASMANDYYKKSLDAAKEIVAMNAYSLYNKAANKSDNFYEALTKKNGDNPEVIFVKDFDGSTVRNGFTGATIPRSMSTNKNGGSGVSPSLNLVEDYELIDKTKPQLVTRATGNEEIESSTATSSVAPYKIYDNAGDIFANRDPRLAGTILLPGSTFRGKNIELWAGLAVWNGNGYDFKTVADMGDLYKTGLDTTKWIFQGRQITGGDGPNKSTQSVSSSSGFLLRKYVDVASGSETDNRSGLAYVRYRYAEILLNGAEAAFELGDRATALDYVNQIRRRAGVGELTDAELSIDAIRHERRVELAFEDHIYYDLKRWRMGDQYFNGANTSSTVYALWPYKIYRPGDASDGKWIFRRMINPKKTYPVKFLNGNYYSAVNGENIKKNNLLVKNPYQN